MDYIAFKPIGIIYSQHEESEKTPIQPVYAEGCEGKIKVYQEYAEGLKDLSEFSHIYLLYYFNQTKETKLLVKPFLEDVQRGVFATRAPVRPNKIGISIVKLNKIEKNYLYVENIDILNKTPLLDIKPYTAKFDNFEVIKSGWQDNIDENTANEKGKREYAKFDKE